MRYGRVALVGVAAAVGSVGAIASAAGPVAAKDGDVIRRGSCSAASDWKLKASEEDGRIEVEGEVDSNVVGQRWRWTIRHNGGVSASGRRVTSGPSGSFEVRRVIVDVSGPDRVGWRARNPRTGETCRGSLTF